MTDNPSLMTRLRQFNALTKPRVIQLIVFCALIGMVLANTIPISAQNTINWMTRGLVSALNWRKRVISEGLSVIQFSVYALHTTTTPW